MTMQKNSGAKVTLTAGKLVMLCCLAGMLVCAQAAPLARIEDFDRIVAPAVQQSAGKRLKLSSPVTDGGRRQYVGEYAFKKAASGEHAMLLVVIAPGGELLSEDEYRRRIDRVREEQKTRVPGYSDYELPPLGKRAIRRFFGFGPGGAGYGLVFTTSDGRYDVEVAVSTLLPMGADVPDTDIDAVAAGIARRYDQLLR